MFSDSISNKKVLIMVGGLLALVFLVAAALVFYKYSQKTSGDLPKGNSVDVEQKAQQQTEELDRIRQERGLNASSSAEEMKQDNLELEKIRQERNLQTPTPQELQKQSEELNRLRGLVN